MDNWFKSKWFVRVVSLAFAIMLYVFVYVDANSTQSNAALPGSSNESQIIDDVPVEIRIDEENYVVSGVPESVTVSLSGPPSVLRPVSIQKNFNVYVDLEGLGEGEHTVEIEHDITEELEVYIEPKSVDIFIEERASGQFPVSVEFINTNEIPDGYELGDYEINPEEVTITSSKAIIDQIQIVKVFVDVSGVTKSINNRELPINVYDGQGNELNVRMEPETVEVSVEVNNPSKTVNLVVPTKGKLPDGLRLVSINPNLEEITIYGKSDLLANINSIETEEVDLSKISDSGTMDVGLSLPEGVIAPQVDTIEITVEVEEIENDTEETSETAKTRTINDIPIEVQGLRDGQAYSFIQPESGEMDITVSGNRSTVDGLSINDFLITVDVTNLATGEHQVPVAMDGPDVDELTLTSEYEEVTIEIH